ncbi:hypothetical protein [Paenibacillus sp. DCT19]|uniref:hypothetical protein n=1 Tax=Paenibacillus sp. DCT19 TaxID=2211212 RepID=UPI000FE1E055|nr:hypothetical protein [Paenibacillus sp. DCT19]
MNQQLSRMKTYGSQRHRNLEQKEKSEPILTPELNIFVEAAVTVDQGEQHRLPRSLYLDPNANPCQHHWRVRYFQAVLQHVPKHHRSRMEKKAYRKQVHFLHVQSFILLAVCD